MRRIEMSSIYTDLALEAKELYQKHNDNKEIPGVEVVVLENNPDITVTRVNIFSIQGEKAMDKPQGCYTTIDAPKLKDRDPEFEEEVSKALAEEIKSLIKTEKKKPTILVVGLGNWNVTPDALGPRVVSQMMVTRHLLQMIPDEVDERVNAVCTIAPGVLGITGIETGEIIKGVADRVKPDLVIAIDALASRKTDRISTTIQITDTGISPGSGIGNKRMGINSNTLGMPVIAIGVPMVVYAVTISQDALTLLIEEFSKQAGPETQFFKVLQDMNEERMNQLIGKVVSNHMGDLVVTPKEIDVIMSGISKILANGINMALHQNIELEEISRFMH